jgi:C1A family cysteine protease
MTDKIKTTKLKKHFYGWKADRPDQRDKLFAHIMKIPKKIPESVDLRKYCSKIENQLELGSCTSNAIVGGLEFLEIKDKVHFEDLSRLFLYYEERVIEHSVNYDSGAEIRDGIKALTKWGICGENCWPYDISKFTEKPPAKCYDEAKKHILESYYRILTLAEMKTCLADGFPFSFGFTIYSSFETEEVANTGLVPMPGKDEDVLGGHAVLSVGYDVKKKIFSKSMGSFLVRNSWGTDWGIAGYFWIPMEYLINRYLSDDFWTMRRAENL